MRGPGPVTALLGRVFATDTRCIWVLMAGSVVLVRFYFARGGVSWAGDGSLHLTYAALAARAIADGDLPIWTNYFAAGSPFLQFYGFLFFYVVGILELRGQPQLECQDRPGRRARAVRSDDVRFPPRRPAFPAGRLCGRSRLRTELLAHSACAHHGTPAAVPVLRLSAVAVLLLRARQGTRPCRSQRCPRRHGSGRSHLHPSWIRRLGNGFPHTLHGPAAGSCALDPARLAPPAPLPSCCCSDSWQGPF
jgi:hypothetical protein